MLDSNLFSVVAFLSTFFNGRLKAVWGRNQKTVLKICVVVFVSLLFPAIGRADGSKDLYPSGTIGYRAYLGSHTVTTAYNPFPTTGTHYVYVNVGDTLYAGSSVQGLTAEATTPLIIFTDPNGVTQSSTAGSNTGRIQNRAEELNGPDYPGYSAGYSPFFKVVGAGQAGVWKVDFISRNTGTAGNPTNILANSEWSGAPGTENMIAAWDISVRRGGIFLPGRVFTTMFHGVMNDGFTNGFYGKFYVLTKQGYNYLVDNNGQQGLNFAFFSNNKGVKDSRDEASYSSYNSTTSVPIKDPRESDGANDVTQKLFYRIPASDLPSVASSDAGYVWLRQSSPQVPTVTNFGFSGVEGLPIMPEQILRVVILVLEQVMLQIMLLISILMEIAFLEKQ
jgi:hypothetical protein